MEIAIFIPTLFRPYNVDRVISSIRETTQFPYEIYLMCPEDDIETINVIEKLIAQFG